MVNNNPVINNVWVTFIQASEIVSGQVQLLGSPLQATYTSGTDIVSIENGVSYALSDINNTITMGPTDWNGHLYISNAVLNVQLDNNVPVDMDYTDIKDTTSYQMLEFAGSDSSANIDITYINWYSIPLQMQSTTAQTSQTRGVPLDINLLELINSLAALTQYSSNTVVRNPSHNSPNQIVRVISPNAGNPTWLPLYHSFNDYLTAIFGSEGNKVNIPVNNTYDGVGNPPSPDFEPQTYTVSTVSYCQSTETLSIAGTTSLLDDFSMQSTMNFAQFNQAVYLAVMSYSWSYAGNGGNIPSGKNLNGNTGDNNVFSAVSRDLLAGFAFGFIGSQQFGQQPSSNWMTATNKELFSYIQPNNKYYNVWANEFNKYFSDVYTFPFNDFITAYAPELMVNTGDTLTVTLLDWPQLA